MASAWSACTSGTSAPPPAVRRGHSRATGRRLSRGRRVSGPSPDPRIAGAYNTTTVRRAAVALGMTRPQIGGPGRIVVGVVEVPGCPWLDPPAAAGAIDLAGLDSGVPDLSQALVMWSVSTQPSSRLTGHRCDLGKIGEGNKRAGCVAGLACRAVPPAPRHRRSDGSPVRVAVASRRRSLSRHLLDRENVHAAVPVTT